MGVVNRLKYWDHRLWYWWHEKPSSQRRLIVYGASCSLFLLALGLFFDSLGKPFYDKYPFLSSIPKDLFKLVAIGTLSVLLLDELRASWRAFPEIRGRAPEVRTLAGDVTLAALFALGRGKKHILYGIKDYPSAAMVSDQAIRLWKMASLCRNLALKTPVGDVPTGEVQTVWHRTTLNSYKVPEESDTGDLVRLTDDFASKLSDMGQFFPAAGRDNIGEIQVHLSRLPQTVKTAQAGMRLMLSKPTMQKEEMTELGSALDEIGHTLSRIADLLSDLKRAGV